ncbi:MAG TPA: PilZ domain-containing protein [Tepidisphaeraceae bacterium]|nr:PilZ domain-containing protein [Tepidisphaeraceae bacterium]
MVAAIADEVRPEDRRRGARQTLVVKGMLFPDASGPHDLPPTGGPRRVCLSNVSMHGVAFRTPLPIEPGTRYRLKIEAGPMTMAGRVRVVACRDKGNHLYEVGAEFVTTEIDPAAASHPAQAARVARNATRMLAPRV